MDTTLSITGDVIRCSQCNSWPCICEPSDAPHTSVHTYRNGERLLYLDLLRDWVHNVQVHFLRQSRDGYEIFPEFPRMAFAPNSWFEKAGDHEKKLMFDMLINELVTTLQCWTYEKDMLYGHGEWSFR